MPRYTQSPEGLLRRIFPDMPPNVSISLSILEGDAETSLADALNRALAILPLTTGDRDHAPRPRAKEILECYYGLNWHEPKTAAEIAEELEISERSIRGIIREAVRTLGNSRNSEQLKKFFVPATATQDQALSE